MDIINIPSFVGALFVTGMENKGFFSIIQFVFNTWMDNKGYFRLFVLMANVFLILVLVLFFALSSQLCGFQTPDLGLASEGVSWEGFRMEDSEFRV